MKEPVLTLIALPGATVTGVAPVARLEPWLDKRGLAAHLACSVRWVEARMADGMPFVMLAGRCKFRASEVEQWLEENGHMRRGEAA